MGEIGNNALTLTPSRALIVCFAGFVGIVCEVRRPGLIWSGALGSAAVLAGFYFCWQQSPTALGMMLVAGASLLFAAEAMARVNFVAGVLATTALDVGLCRLFPERSSTPLLLATLLSVFVGLTIIFLSHSAKRARRNKTQDL